MYRKILLSLSVFPWLAACGDSTGPEGSGRVTVGFHAVAPAPASGSAVSASMAADHQPAPGAMTLVGSNGTLVIQDIRFIVSEIELERSEGSCLREDDDDCEEFEGGPFLVSLLDGTADEVVSAMIPAGSYTELEFEVEDLDLDEDDSGSERQAKQALLAQLRQRYPSFPSDASMVVHGTFDGEPFTVFLAAEIEVEQELNPPLVVPGDMSVTVMLSPELWFREGDRVMDLRAFQGTTIEFEAEFENGVVEIEIDD